MRGKTTISNKSLCVLAAMVFCSGCAGIPSGTRGDAVVVSEYRVRTGDGWTLELKRYRLGDGERLSPPWGEPLPIILCHGLACNGRIWDLGEDISLARYLAGDGYDVWVPSLRGSGRSTKPAVSAWREALILKWPEPAQLFNCPTLSEPEKFNWNFDDHVLKDLPAIIDAVKAKSGHSQVMWVGLSMGGMVMYGYLEKTDRDDVAAFVAVSSAIAIPQPPGKMYRRALHNRNLILIGRTLFNIQGPSTIGALTGWLPGEETRWNVANINPAAVRPVYRNAMEDVSSGLLLQLASLAQTGHLKSADGAFDYTGELHRVKAPILCMVGSMDTVCDPAGVRYAYEHVGSRDKNYVELGRAYGFSADYGHVDTVLGRNSRREVYPIIRNWLATHTTSAYPASSR